MNGQINFTVLHQEEKSLEDTYLGFNLIGVDFHNWHWWREISFHNNLWPTEKYFQKTSARTSLTLTVMWLNIMAALIEETQFLTSFPKSFWWMSTSHSVRFGKSDQTRESINFSQWKIKKKIQVLKFFLKDLKCNFDKKLGLNTNMMIITRHSMIFWF